MRGAHTQGFYQADLIWRMGRQDPPCTTAHNRIASGTGRVAPIAGLRWKDRRRRGDPKRRTKVGWASSERKRESTTIIRQVARAGSQPWLPTRRNSTPYGEGSLTRSEFRFSPQSQLLSCWGSRGEDQQFGQLSIGYLSKGPLSSRGFRPLFRQSWDLTNSEFLESAAISPTVLRFPYFPGTSPLFFCNWWAKLPLFRPAG